jgi:hypothetical protein
MYLIAMTIINTASAEGCSSKLTVLKSFEKGGFRDASWVTDSSEAQNGSNFGHMAKILCFRSCGTSPVVSISSIVFSNWKITLARQLLGGTLPRRVAKSLEALSNDFRFSLSNGELQFIGGSWYVTHTGLLRLARRKRCSGMHVEVVDSLCDSAASRFVLKATVYPSKSSSGFVGYGDADPSNVSFLVHGAEMRVAETRAVNRALRKAYGIGICSVEEIGSAEAPQASPELKKVPPQATNGNGHGSPKVRDRLCQVIRQHQLDPNLVKAYATDFCAVKALRDATREQVEAFVAHLADWAEKDRNALLCQLNSYPSQKEGAA